MKMDMKKFFTPMAMFAIAMLSMTMTSCDDDPWYDYRPNYYNYYDSWYDSYDWYNESFTSGTDQLTEEAQCLRGHWEGTMIAEYTNDQTGRREQSQFYADIEFDQYDSKSLNGRGRETDTAGEDQQELRFAWYIEPRTGDIYIKYDGSGSIVRLDAKSKDMGFSLDDNAFYGYMVGQNIDDVYYFDLTRYTLAKDNNLFEAESAAPKMFKAPVKKTSGDIPVRLRKR